MSGIRSRQAFRPKFLRKWAKAFMMFFCRCGECQWLNLMHMVKRFSDILLNTKKFSTFLGIIKEIIKFLICCVSLCSETEATEGAAGTCRPGWGQGGGDQWSPVPVRDSHPLAHLGGGPWSQTPAQFAAERSQSKGWVSPGSSWVHVSQISERRYLISCITFFIFSSLKTQQ